MIIKESKKDQIVIEDFNDAKEITLLQTSKWKHVMFHISGIVSLGLVYLIFYWYSLYHLLDDEVLNFNKADRLCIVTNDNVIVLVEIKTKEFQTDPFDPSSKEEMRYIYFIERHYAYRSQDKYFYPVETVFGNRFELNKEIEIKDHYKKGLDANSIETLTSTFGLNKLSFPEPSILEMVLVQLIHPIIVGLTILSLLCFLCYKYMQSITLFFYVIFIIVFQVVEYKSRVKKIKEMSEINQKVKIFRREDIPSSGKTLSNSYFLIFRIKCRHWPFHRTIQRESGKFKKIEEFNL
jgi:hypothetical protein